VLGVELELVELVEPALFSATIVCESILPEAARPLDCWNCFRAALVLGPSLPSTGPALKPASLSACWAWVTCELSFDEALAWDDWVASEELGAL
jgi:hypothetical protein